MKTKLPPPNTAPTPAAELIHAGPRSLPSGSLAAAPQPTPGAQALLAAVVQEVVARQRRQAEQSARLVLEAQRVLHARNVHD